MKFIRPAKQFDGQAKPSRGQNNLFYKALIFRLGAKAIVRY